MINMYKFHHCPSLLATPGFKPTTSRSHTGDANHSAIPPPGDIVITDSWTRTLDGAESRVLPRAGHSGRGIFRF